MKYNTFFDQRALGYAENRSVQLFKISAEGQSTMAYDKSAIEFRLENARKQKSAELPHRNHRRKLSDSALLCVDPSNITRLSRNRTDHQCFYSLNGINWVRCRLDFTVNRPSQRNIGVKNDNFSTK